MGIAGDWEKRVIRTNITYAKRTVRIFSVSPKSHSLFSALFKTRGEGDSSNERGGDARRLA